MIKVMIADDQELIRESLKIVLSTHEDIEVEDTASDGYEVLKCLVFFVGYSYAKYGWCYGY